MHGKGFPEELEVIIRDLWVLKLQISYPDPKAQRERSMSRSRAGTVDGGAEGGGEPAEDGGWDTDIGDGASSSYLYSSSSAVSASTSCSSRRKQRIPKERPILIDTLVLCYLGLLLLRCSVPLGDLYRWTLPSTHTDPNSSPSTSIPLPYSRAVKEIPVAMRSRLGSMWTNALDHISPLQLTRLAQSVQDTVILFNQRFGMTFPPINREILLARFINELGLPLEIYPATKRLAEKLLITTFEWRIHWMHRRGPAFWPEVQLMALIVIATRLMYGLDGEKRYPTVAWEPASVGLDWTEWEKFLREGDAERKGLFGKNSGGVVGKLEVDVMEGDVLNMDGEDMDRYMDWYEKMWCAEDEGVEKLTPGILNLFPFNCTDSNLNSDSNSSENQNQKQTLHTRISNLHSNSTLIHPLSFSSSSTLPSPQNPSQSTHKPNPSPPAPTKNKPGTNYFCLPGQESGPGRSDECVDMPRQLATLMQAAADVLAVKRSYLYLAVRRLECLWRKIVKDRRKWRGRVTGVGGDMGDIEGNTEVDDTGVDWEDIDIE